MYLSKITLVQSSQATAELMRLGKRGQYATHQLLWRLFTEDGKRQFLYREEHSPTGLPEYYVLSRSEPLAAPTLFSIQTKNYQPVLKTGDRLGFKLRVNPTVSIKNAKGKSQKHDVMMHAKRQAKQQGTNTGATLKRLMENAAQAWIADSKRLENWGISLDFLPEVERYTQQLSVKSPTEKIQYSSVDFQGVLTVIEPEKYLNQLINGFGRAKALGCGLMLIRRI